MPDGRLTRRVAGVLGARLPELQLEEVPDPRHERGRKWSLATMLRATTAGLMAGCQSLADVEHLSDELSLPMRRQLGLARRLPDTTLRDTLVAVDPQELRRPLWRQAKAAHRRKALAPCGLPFGVVAMDGKGTHNLLDKFFAEDTHPVIEADPRGMLNVMLLRRMGLNALALFRGVTQRADERRHPPWRAVIRWVYNTLIAATEPQLAGLRSRSARAPGA